MSARLNDSIFKVTQYSIDCSSKFKSLYPYCYVTQEQQIDRICHSCGRPMSKSVASFTYPSTPSLSFLFVNKEFEGLNLEDSPEGDKGIHCEHCVKLHHHHSWLWQPIFVLLIFVTWLMHWIAGKVLVYVQLEVISTTQNMLVIVIGLGFLALLLEVSDYRKSLIKNRPPFPVIGINPFVYVSEEIFARINLNREGNYSEDLYSNTGTINLEINLTPFDYERMRIYIDKYRLFQIDKFMANAGFILFDSKHSVRFVNHRYLLGSRVNTLALEKEIQKPSFPVLDKEHLWKWKFKEIYEQQGTNLDLPIQIFPEIVNEGNRLALELTLQVKHSLRSQKKPFLYELNLNCPWKLGQVESVNPTADIRELSTTTPGGSNHVISWESVEINQCVTGLNYEYYVFYVRFQNDVQPEMMFSGNVHMRVFESIMGLKNFRYFYPQGTLRFDSKERSPKMFTDIFVEFSLDMNSMILRRVIKKEDILKRTQVKPNHLMVNDLVNGLGSIGAYVQRVIENPPRTNKAHASIMNRFWDIAGRYYVEKGIYPIDFHIVLVGKEEYIDSDLPNRGETLFEITVQATTHNFEMEKEVDLLFKKLTLLIRDLNDSSSY